MRTSIPSILASLAMSAAAAAQSTAFTYQGQLSSSGAPTNGLHDFRFRLFDAATGGTQVAATLCVDNVQVQGGIFTATLDFGSQFSTPAPRFIEIEVRRDTGLDCSNLAGFVLLSSRQLIAATPVAIHAHSAFALDSADGSRSRAVMVDNNGKVGIGTAAPTHSVHIASPEPTLALQDTDSTGQQVGYVSYRDSGNVERAWVGYGSAGDPDFSVVNARLGGDIVLLPFTGNVGIGTASPGAKLEVRGDIRMGPQGQHLAVGGEENLRVLRGNLTSAGVRAGGSGWSPTHLSTGHYFILYNTPFATVPTVVASSTEFSVIVSLSGESEGGCALIAQNTSGAFADVPLRFIVTGAR